MANKVVLFKDNETVKLFNDIPVSKQRQREMTVEEFQESLQLYKRAEQFFEEFINRPWHAYELNRVINKVRHNANTKMFQEHSDATKYLECGNEYMDIYFIGERVDISVTLDAWEENDPIKLSQYFDVEVKNQGLDYAYEQLTKDKEQVILSTREELEEFYSE